MKEVILKHWRTNLIILTVIYFFRTVIFWHFYNPFDWLIKFPEYSTEDRACWVFGLTFWQGIQFFLIYINSKYYQTT